MQIKKNVYFIKFQINEGYVYLIKVNEINPNTFW